MNKKQFSYLVAILGDMLHLWLFKHVQSILDYGFMLISGTKNNVKSCSAGILVTILDSEHALRFAVLVNPVKCFYSRNTGDPKKYM